MSVPLNTATSLLRPSFERERFFTCLADRSASHLGSTWLGRHTDRRVRGL